MKKRCIPLLLALALLLAPLALAKPVAAATVPIEYSFEEPTAWTVLDFGNHYLLVILDAIEDIDSKTKYSFALADDGSVRFYAQASTTSNDLAFSVMYIWDAGQLAMLQPDFVAMGRYTFDLLPPGSLGSLVGVAGNVSVTSSLITGSSLTPGVSFSVPQEDDAGNTGNWLPDIGSWFSDLGAAIGDALASLGQFLLDGLKNLFVPGEDYFTSKIAALQERFAFYEEALAFGSSIEVYFRDLGHSSPPVLEFTLDAPNSSWWQSGPVPISISFDWYAAWKPYVDVILGAFILLQYFYRIYLSLPGIISGASGFISSGFRFEGAMDREAARTDRAVNRDPDGDYMKFLKSARDGMK